MIASNLSTILEVILGLRQVASSPAIVPAERFKCDRHVTATHDCCESSEFNSEGAAASGNLSAQNARGIFDVLTGKIAPESRMIRSVQFVLILCPLR